MKHEILQLDRNSGKQRGVLFFKCPMKQRSSILKKYNASLKQWRWLKGLSGGLLIQMMRVQAPHEAGSLYCSLLSENHSVVNELYTTYTNSDFLTAQTQKGK